jgi:hypothetical protein
MTAEKRQFKPGDVVYEHEGECVLWSEIPPGGPVVIVGVVQTDGTIKKHRVDCGRVKRWEDDY